MKLAQAKTKLTAIWDSILKKSPKSSLLQQNTFSQGQSEMTNGVKQALDPNRRSEEILKFEKQIKKLVIGQDDAVNVVVKTYQNFLTGLNPPNRPIANLLFLGPTGSGKTRIVEAMAETLFNNHKAMIKIDCSEFQYGHEIAKLIGSPPGYLGHRETHPLLTQQALDQHHTEKLKLSILLLDEIEKANDSLWRLLLGIMDKATLTLGDNRTVNFSKVIIFMTSNLATTEMENLINYKLGFKSNNTEVKESKLSNVALNVIKKKFTPEFLNRLDDIVVFKTLKQKDIEQILEIELGNVQKRIFDITKIKQFVFIVTSSAKKFLLEEGMSTQYGARHLKRTIEKHIVAPLSNLISTDQINLGDLVGIDYKYGKIKFTREAENALGPTILNKWSDNVESFR